MTRIEPRLDEVLTSRFGRIMVATLAAFGAVVIAAYAITTEVQLRRSLESSADVIEALLGLYADPSGEPTTVAPEMLADQLVGMDQPFLITREAGDAGMRKVYFLSPTMPAKRLEGVAASPDEIRTLLIAEITDRARWRDRLLHRESGDFDIYVMGSRQSLVAGVLVLSLAALALLPVALWVARRATRRTVAAALGPVSRIAEVTSRIGPDQLDRRLDSPTGQAEATALANAINDMLTRVDASHTQLKAFTADASHELRTPLTHLKAQVEWALSEGRSPEAVRESLEAIERELERTTKMTEDLLLIARGEGGLLEFESNAFELTDLLAEVQEIAEAMAEPKGLRLEVRANGAARVRGDPTRARHALLNLVANAVRYTDRGTVTIELLRRDDRWGLAVRDDGPGVAPEQQELIFDRFYRVDGSRSRAHGGAGLGLTIARLFTRLQHGDITVESVPGQGSTFTMWLPAA